MKIKSFFLLLILSIFSFLPHQLVSVDEQKNAYAHNIDQFKTFKAVGFQIEACIAKRALGLAKELLRKNLEYNTVM